MHEKLGEPSPPTTPVTTAARSDSPSATALDSDANFCRYLATRADVHIDVAHAGQPFAGLGLDDLDLLGISLAIGELGIALPFLDVTRAQSVSGLRRFCRDLRSGTARA